MQQGGSLPGPKGGEVIHDPFLGWIVRYPQHKLVPDKKYPGGYRFVGISHYATRKATRQEVERVNSLPARANTEEPQ